MAVEPKRGCGYRKVGGLYLCGGLLSASCDRLPYELNTCPVCGSGIKFSRGFTWIEAHKMFGIHKDCLDPHKPCWMCQPKPEVKYGLLWVGEAYYSPEHFIKEAIEMGVSKRIPFIPKELKLSETVVLLAHKKGIAEEIFDMRKEDYEYHPAIFYAFKPTVVEMLVYESELTDEKREELAKRGITPISIPDGDIDHSDEKTTIAYDPVTKRFSRVLLEE